MFGLMILYKDAKDYQSEDKNLPKHLNLKLFENNYHWVKFKIWPLFTGIKLTFHEITR